MREFMIIFNQAFVTKAKTKSFIITTALMIAAIFLFANMGKIIDTVQNVTGGEDAAGDVLYVGDAGSGILADSFENAVEANESGMTVEQSDETEQVLMEQVKEGEIDSFLTLALDDTNTIQAKFTNECHGIQFSDDAPGCAPIDSDGIESGRVIIVREQVRERCCADSI